MPFEDTLSLPIQEALYKFREASEQELIRLRKEGLDPSSAINKLVEKMRTTGNNSPNNISPCFSRQELELVMEIAGINEEGAMRALILRSELAKLRQDGFNHPEAINELSRRMKRLAGSKRRVSLTSDPTTLNTSKHRKREGFSSSLPAPLNIPLVPFTSVSQHLDPVDSEGLNRSRKRLQDALMMDEEGEWRGNGKRARHFDKDISDSDESDDVQYNFEDVGEFSQDEEKEKEANEEGIDDVFGVNSLDDIPLFAAHFDYSPSSDDEPTRNNRYKDTEAEEDADDAHSNKSGEIEQGIHFRDVRDNESDSDSSSWPFPPHSSRTSTTTTTTTTTTSTTDTSDTTTTPNNTTTATFTPSFQTLLTPSIPLLRATRTIKYRDLHHHLTSRSIS